MEKGSRLHLLTARVWGGGEGEEGKEELARLPERGPVPSSRRTHGPMIYTETHRNLLQSLVLSHGIVKGCEKATGKGKGVSGHLPL